MRRRLFPSLHTEPKMASFSEVEQLIAIDDVVKRGRHVLDKS
jgi:hypothetical protein